MIAYVDTSALTPLIINEPGSERAGRVWDTAGHLTSVRLIYAEACAALVQAARLGRLSDAHLETAVDALEDLYAQLDLMDVDDPLVRRAGEPAQQRSLRGYVAVHLAAAERVASETTVLVSGDRDLCTTAGALGLAVVDTSNGCDNG